MPINKKTGKKVPYTNKNMSLAKAGKGGLTMGPRHATNVKKSSHKTMRGPTKPRGGRMGY